MHNGNDRAARCPPIVLESDAANPGTEDVLGDLNEPAVGVDSPGVDGMEVTDYALSTELHPVLSFVPRSYQVEALAAWQRCHRRGVVVLPTGAGADRGTPVSGPPRHC